MPRVYVPPRRLWRLLDDAAHAAVTVVVAPAGAGKTYGVAGWATRAQGPDGSGGRGPRTGPVTWVVASAGTSADALGGALGGLLRRARAEDTAARGAEHRGLLVVDEADALRSEALGVLEEVLAARSTALRVVLLSRRDLPLERAASQLLGDLVVLRGDALHVEDDAARAIVRAHAPACPAAVVERIVEEAGGWCAALVLGARNAHVGAPAGGVHPRPFDPVVADLVARDVFASMTPRERHLLLSVAHENAVTPAVAVHLANDPGAADLLERLALTGLLVTRSSSPGADAFRVHPVLADVVRRRFTAGGVDAARARATIGRAARADVAGGEVTTGLRRMVAAGGTEQAADVLDAHGVALVLRGHGAAVRSAARACADVLEARAGAHLALALERRDAGDAPGAALHLAQVLAGPGTPTPTDTAVGRLLRAMLGLEPVDRAVAAALAAAASGPDPGPGRRSLLLALVGEAQVWLGDRAAGEARLAAAARAARNEGSVRLGAEATEALALARYVGGRVSDAGRLAADALRGRPPRDGGRTPRFVQALAALHDDPWGAAAGDDLPEPGSHLLEHFWAHVAGGLVRALRGHAHDALDVLAAPPGLPELPPWLEATRLTVRGLVAAAVDDARGLAEGADRLRGAGAEGEARLAEGLLAVVGRDLPTALRHLRGAADAGGLAQPDVVGTALVCAAQVAEARGDWRQAAALVAAAVDRGERRGDALPFVGWLGHVPPVPSVLGRVGVGTPWGLRMLAAARRAGSVRTLVARRTPTPAEIRRASGRVVPPLTRRERDVLDRLARGASYADIADDLVLSANTVKTHVTSLYAKLGAARRSEALATARALDLL